MNARLLSTGLISVAVLSGAAVWAFAQPAARPPAAPTPAKAADKPGAKAGEGADEEGIDPAQAPEAVRAAALRLAGSEKAIKKIIKEDDEGVYTYEVEYTADGVACSAIFSAAGDLMERETPTTEARLPAAVMAALKKEYPKATFQNPASVQKFYFEIDIVIDGESHEVKIDAAGNIEDERGGNGDDDGQGKGEENENGEKHEGRKDGKN